MIQALSLGVLQSLGEYAGITFTDIRWFLERAADRSIALASAHKLEVALGAIGLFALVRFVFGGRR